MTSIPNVSATAMRLCVYVLSGGMALAAYWLTSGHALFSWDSVNFALGVEHIDIAAHRPHPPGYIALIAAARFLQFGADVPTALLRVTALAAGLNAILVWEFMLGATRSRSAAWIAWSVAISSPLCWFYASTAEVYGLELLSSLSCGAAAIACLRHPSRTWPAVALGVAFGLSILVKPTVSVLMAPLWLYVGARLSGGARRRVVVAGVGGMAVGVMALAAIVPVHQLVSLTQDQLGGTLAGGARFDPFHLMNRRLRDVSYALCAALGLGGVVACAWRRRHAGSELTLTTLALWAGPYLLMCIALHFPKPGYVLPLVAPLAAWLAVGYVGRSVPLTASVSIMICVVNLLQFWAQPWPDSVTAGAKRYADKTTSEKAATEINSILRPTLASIRQVDGAVERLLASVPPSCARQRGAVVVESGGLVTWRHVMFYLRQPLSLQLEADGGLAVTAQGGEARASTDGPQARVVGCLGLLSRTGSTLTGSAVTATPLAGQTVYWSIGTTTVTWTRQGGLRVEGATHMTPSRQSGVQPLSRTVVLR